LEKKLELMKVEEKLNNPTLKKKMTKKQKKFARIVEKYHKPNPKIMRLRELNRQKNIFPFVGLKEILAKKVDLE
jgi:LysM repeat protein